MKCTLMHKQKAVAQMELDEITGFILKITDVSAGEHLPVGVSFRSGIADRAALNDWWTDRAIPASRSGVRNALEYLNLSNTKMLLVRCFGLSLSDQYWIKPQDEDITWEQINFFDNPFSEDIGDVLFGTPKKLDGFDFSSPDNTSDGCLKKRWKIVNGKRCLIKGGSDLARQQPFNEVIAAKLMERLNIPHAAYELFWDNGSPYCVCEDFVTADTELISAWRIMQTRKKPNDVSVYRHFVHCCTELGVDIIRDLDRMIVLDYIIANEDRHLNNFGLLRNADTLAWLGFAPIYDSGSSLGYDKVASQIRAQSDRITCKPFKKKHIDQLKLVSDFSWIDFEALSDVGEIIRETMSGEQAQELIDERRITAITDSVKKRIETLQGIALTHSLAADTTEGDVEEDIAEDYTPKMDL